MELAGDLLVGQTVGDQHEHLRLPRGEPVRSLGALRGNGRLRFGQPLQQAPLNARREPGVPGQHAPHGPYDLVAARVLGEIAAGPGSERGEQRGVVGVRGEHDDLCPGVFGPDASGRLHPVAAGHAQVHQHDVRIELGHQPHGLVPIGGGPDDLDPRQQPEQHHDALAHHGLIVRHDDTGRCPALLRHTGTFSITTNPSSYGPASSEPPSSSARSRIPSRPYPAPECVNSPGGAPESLTFNITSCSP